MKNKIRSQGVPAAWAQTLVVVLLGLAGCGGGAGSGQGQGGGMPPAAVAVQAVAVQDLPAVYEYTGQTAGVRDVEVRARVGGIVLQRHFKEGAVVRKGQVLFTLDRAALAATAARLEADLAAAQARQAQAARSLERLRTLYESRMVTQREHDDAASAEQVTRADVKAAQARLREARINLGYTQVTAPSSGVIGRSLQSEGTLVPGPEMLLATISQLDPIEVRFGIADTDQLRWRDDAAAGRLALPPGGAFDVELTLADGRLLPRKGRLQFTDVRVSATTGTLEAQAEIANPDGLLKPGQFVRVRLSGAHRPRAITVPSRAVLDGPQGKFVYLAQEGKAQQRPVQVGEQLGEHWLITQGLAAGDPVIVDGVMRIGPGAPVQVGAPAAAGAAAAASGAAPGATAASGTVAPAPAAAAPPAAGAASK